MKRKDLLKTIIVDNQNRTYPESWERELVVPIDTGKIITLSGVRRCGKTYHLYNLITKLLERGVERERIVYLNFEDERLDLKTHDLQEIVTGMRELYPDMDLAECYFFFDEIQEVDGWERFVTRLYNDTSKHVFLTGSNAKLLSREIATSLRGRALNFQVYPLRFIEFLKIVKPNLDSRQSTDQAKILGVLKKFINQGGFPELIREKIEYHQTILQEYFNVMLMRDLVERYDISQSAIIKYFCKRMIGSSGGEISVNKIYLELKSQGYKISKDTLYEYFGYTEAIYMVQLVPKYSHSIVKSELSQKKIYVIDTGLGIAMDYKLSQDKGRLLENMVVMELIKMGKQVSYQKNESECDLVIVERGQVVQAIQVCEQMDDLETKKREVNGLVATCQAHGLKKGYIVTMDDEAEFTEQGVKVVVVPAWRFLTER